MSRGSKTSLGGAREQTEDVQAAYTYAWWLVGDTDLATRTVHSVAASGVGMTREGLVRGIRHAVADTAALSRASEIALLHDAIGLPLAVAAEIAAATLDEARPLLLLGRRNASVKGTIDARIAVRRAAFVDPPVDLYPASAERDGPRPRPGGPGRRSYSTWWAAMIVLCVLAGTAFIVVTRNAIIERAQQEATLEEIGNTGP